MSSPDDAKANDDEQPPTDSSTDESLPSGEPAPPVSAADEPAETSDEAAAEDDLPEWEPLTPELVEEEAIRGDFMLRWAAILLAMLMGWTIVDRTEVLVHVKTGQYLASHGLLPPAGDVFSATATDHRWVNLSWLWDLIVGVTVSAVGPSGLSVLVALIALATFWVVAQIGVPGVPTWWGSVCAVLAAVACFPSLTATPHLVTLLGVACTMWLLYRRQWDPTRSLWPLVGLFVLWGNLDGRAWIGGVILLLFTLGTWIDGFRSLPEGERQPPLKAIGLVTLCSLPALLVHPFLWETWLAPLRLYGVEYPVLRSYASSDLPYAFERFSAAFPRFWEELGLFNATSLLLMLIAGVTILLNRERLRASTALVLLGINVIGIAGAREMAVASIVNAIAATINGQQWYRATFRQSYSVETAELLFSRGGRALTVIAVFGLAFAVVGGHFMGAQGRRVGMGLAPELVQRIASYRSLLADRFDDRAFNFRLEQGDVLIWIGMKPFIDSRARLYGGSDSLVSLHQKLRLALRASSNDRADGGQPVDSEIASDSQVDDVTPPDDLTPRELWTNAFDQYEINLALPRLSGASPDYITYVSLLKSPDWQMTGQEAASASFYRTNSGDAELAAYLREHDPAQLITRFRRPDDREPQPESPASLHAWPRPPSFYDSYVYLPHETIPNGVRLAEHYVLLRDVALQNQQVGDAVAYSYEAIRSAWEGLRDDPDRSGGYRILGMSYQFLEAVENSIQQSRDAASPLNVRFYQIVSAYHQALECAPGDADLQYRLFETYNAHDRYDLALKYLDLVEQATGRLSLLSATHPNRAEQLQQNETRMAELQEGVERVREQIGNALASGSDRLSVAQTAYGNGYPLLALEVLEEDLTLAASNPLARLLMGNLLLEVGRTAEALQQLESLRGTPVEQQSPQWPIMDAYANLAANNLSTVQTTLEAGQTRLTERIASALLESLPLKFVGPMPTSDGLQWGDAEATAPIQQIQTVAVMNSVIRAQLEQHEILRALIAIEAGNIDQAAELFDQVISRNPHSAARPLIEQYLLWIADRQLPPPPQTDEMPQEPALFTEKEQQDDQPDEPADDAEPADEDAAGADPDRSETPPAT